MYRFTVYILYVFIFPDVLQHEKFTSGLQLSHKPCNSETNTTSHKSPAKTPTKTAKSPSGGRGATDGVASSRGSQAKPVDAHKAEERTGGEELGSMKLLGHTESYVRARPADVL